jgi:hypothetical protein
MKPPKGLPGRAPTATASVSDRPYQTALQTIEFCQVALVCSPPPKQRRVLVDVLGWAIARLSPLVRSDAARMSRINQINQRKRVDSKQAAREIARVEELLDRYRGDLHGRRFTRKGATGWIVANSQIPKKRVQRYLNKVIPHGRGDKVFDTPTG